MIYSKDVFIFWRPRINVISSSIVSGIALPVRYFESILGQIPNMDHRDPVFPVSIILKLFRFL